MIDSGFTVLLSSLAGGKKWNICGGKPGNGTDEKKAQLKVRGGPHLSLFSLMIIPIVRGGGG